MEVSRLLESANRKSAQVCISMINKGPQVNRLPLLCHVTIVHFAGRPGLSFFFSIQKRQHLKYNVLFVVFMIQTMEI